MENNFKTVTEEEWNIHIEDKGEFIKDYYIDQMKKGNTELKILKTLMEIDLRDNFIRENNLVNFLETNLCIRVQIHHIVFLDGFEQERLRKNKRGLKNHLSKDQGYPKDMFHE